jgi:probable phosphoglycerate mutase
LILIDALSYLFKRFREYYLLNCEICQNNIRIGECRLSMLLNLVRHGETTWNEVGKVQGQADPPLNKSGIEQAQIFSKEIQKEIQNYKKVYTSTLQRAVKTAEIITKSMTYKRGNKGIDIELDQRLNSRDLGIFSGMTLAEIKNKYPEHYTKWISGDVTFTPPEGESTTQMLERIKSFLMDLKSKFDESDKIMIVSHRENLGAIIYLITGNKLANPLEGIKNCNSFLIEFK